jgi:transposase
VNRLIRIIEDCSDERIPDVARTTLLLLVDQMRAVHDRITVLEKKLKVWHRGNEASQRLADIPGVGVITATALVATIDDASQFRSARQLSAWLGLVPRQSSSGGKDRLGRISKRGDGYLRRLLVHGARAVLRWSRSEKKAGPKQGRTAWQQALLARRPTNVVLVAMANKTARMVWAMLSRNEPYRPLTANAA